MILTIVILIKQENMLLNMFLNHEKNHANSQHHLCADQHSLFALGNDSNKVMCIPKQNNAQTEPDLIQYDFK